MLGWIELNMKPRLNQKLGGWMPPPLKEQTVVERRVFRENVNRIRLAIGGDHDNRTRQDELLFLKF